jgi:hypothetical protein
MDVNFFVDIIDSSGAKLGKGPLSTVEQWSSKVRMDRAGEFSFSLPASDPSASVIDEKLIARCYAIEAGGIIKVGSGVIDKIETIPDSAGNLLLQVSGDDTMRELNYRSVHFLAFENSGAAITHTTAMVLVEALAPAGWDFVSDPTPPNDSVYHKFAGETVLAAASRLAELSENHFYLSDERQLTFSSTWTSSGLRAIEAPFAPDITDPNTCYISSIRYAEETFDLITRIYPYGAGEYEAALSMADATRTAPSGYTLDTGANFICNDSAESTYGRIEAVRQYRDIAPISATAADEESAANALYDIAFEELQRRSAPALTFDLAITHCPQVLRPMQTIRCVFRRVAQGRVVASINQQLNIIEATTTIDRQRGLRTTGLTVSTERRYPETDADPIVNLVRANQLRG